MQCRKECETPHRINARSEGTLMYRLGRPLQALTVKAGADWQHDNATRQQVASRLNTELLQGPSAFRAAARIREIAGDD